MSSATRFLEPRALLRSLYDWTLGLAAHRHALWALAAISFIESSIFPIPPDILLIPMILAAREKAWRIAAVCTIASVLGGGAGYAIGFFLFETVGQWLLDIYGYAAEFAEVQTRFNEDGFWWVLMAGLTPFPYKVITIASGVTRLDLGLFMATSVVARGARFFLLAVLLWYFGPPIRSFIERWLGLLTIAGFVLLLGGFAVAKMVL
jgi:membrane protein YqaA with SNARE-associated domain